MWQIRQMPAQCLDRLAATWSDKAREVTGPDACESRMKGLTLQDGVHSRADIALQIVATASRSLDRRRAVWHDLPGFFRFSAGVGGAQTFAQGSQVAVAQSVKETT